MKISGILSAFLIVLTLSACASGVSGSVSTATPGRAFPLAAGTPLPGNLALISPSNAGQITQLARWGEGTLQAIVSSPRAKLLAVATSLGVELLDSSTLDLLRFIPSNASLTSLAFTPDGNTLAAGAADGSLFLFRVSDGKLLRTLAGHTGIVLAVEFISSGRTLLSASADQTARLWNVSSGGMQRLINGLSYGVLSAAFSPDGKLLAWGTRDNSVRLYRISDGSLASTLQGHTGPVDGLAFSPDGHLLASASGDNTSRL